jgi:hypothetical protein
VFNNDDIFLSDVKVTPGPSQQYEHDASQKVPGPELGPPNIRLPGDTYAMLLNSASALNRAFRRLPGPRKARFLWLVARLGRPSPRLPRLRRWHRRSRCRRQHWRGHDRLGRGGDGRDLRLRLISVTSCAKLPHPASGDSSHTGTPSTRTAASMVPSSALGSPV